MTAVLSPPHLLPPLTSLRVLGRGARPAVPAPRSQAAERLVATPVAYGRRRLLALALLVVLALPAQVTALVAVTAAGRAVATTATSEAVPASPAATPALQTVAAPTTSCAPATRSGRSPANPARGRRPPLVDLLAERAGGSALQPGQRLDLHGLGS
jgi:hypothetical protein